MSFSFSAGTILQLYINYPHWRLAVSLRLFAALLASTAVTCDALILRWKPVPAGVPWWNFQSLNTGIPFFVCSISIIWTAASLIKLFFTHKPIHPGADVGVDLFVSLLLAPNIAFAILGPANQWEHNGENGIQTLAGKLELVVIACLIIMLSIHFTFFAWACRRVDVKRRLERRESCDRCLAMQLREKIASLGSDMEAMPSRAYHTLHDGHIRISPVSTSPTAVSPNYNNDTPPSPPAPAFTPGFASPIFTETIPKPPVNTRYHELDVERTHMSYPPSELRSLQHGADNFRQDHGYVSFPPSGPRGLQCAADDYDQKQEHISYTSNSPRRLQYQFDDSEDDEPPPPTPPPKRQDRQYAERPSLQRLHVGPYQPSRPLDVRSNVPGLGEPGRTYSIDSYYYSHQNRF